MDLSLIGKFIKVKRKERGYTQEQFAKELGISRHTLYKIQKGMLGEVSFIKFWTALRPLGYDMYVIRHNPFKRNSAEYVDEENIDEILCDKE